MKKLLSVLLTATIALQPISTAVYAEEYFDEYYDEYDEFVEEESYDDFEEEYTDSEILTDGVDEYEEDEEIGDYDFSDSEDYGFFGLSDAEDGIDITDIESAETYVETEVNPLYEGIVDESELLQADEDEMIVAVAETLMGSVSPLSWSAAASEIRGALKRRESTIQVTISRNFYVGIAGDLWKEALSYTGDALEGDYLSWNYKGYSASVANNTTSVTIVYTITQLTTAAQENEISQRVSQILNSIDLSGNEAGKARSIYNYIYSHASYNGNEADVDHGTAYDALVGSSNSTGLALLSYRLMVAAGVNTRLVYGDTDLGESVWNIVRVDGVYYQCDVASEIVSGNGYDYFLKGTSDIRNHKLPVTNLYNISYSNYCGSFDSDLGEEPTVPGNEEDDQPHVHTPGQAVREHETSATCKRAGYYDEVVYCTECGVCLSSTSHTVPKTDHRPGTPFNESGRRPSCTTAGYHYVCVLCEDCGTELSYTKVVDPAAHVDIRTIELNRVASNCSREGYITEQVYCAECYAVIEEKTTTLPKTSHIAGKAVEENKVAATCTTAGSYNEVVRCTVCNEVISSTPKTISKLAHKEGTAVRENEVAATCTTAGSYNEVVRCTVCNTVVRSTNHSIPATGHTQITVKENEVAATCTTNGSYKEVVKCKDCGTVIKTTNKTVAATGHVAGSVETHVLTAATCGSYGTYEEITRCKNCNVEISRQTKTTATVGSHVAGTSVKENVKAATCTTAGSYDEVVRCTVCNKELSRQTKTVAASGNHIAGVAKKENEVVATCAASGSYDEVVRCTVCNEIISSTRRVVSKVAHEEKSEPRKIYITEPTCKKSGLYVLSYECEYCNAEIRRSATMTESKLGHDYVLDHVEAGQSATCCTKGSHIECKVCTRCSSISKTTVEDGYAEHVAGEAVQENRLEATCSKEGSYDTVHYCTTCGTEIDRTSNSIAKKAHAKTREERIVKTRASYTNDGEIVYNTVCEECSNVVETRSEAIPRIAYASTIENEKITFDGNAHTLVATAQDRTGKILDPSNYTVKCFDRQDSQWKTEIVNAGVYDTKVCFDNELYYDEVNSIMYIIDKATPVYYGVKAINATMNDTSKIKVAITSSSDGNVSYSLEGSCLSATTVVGEYTKSGPGIAKVIASTPETTNYRAGKVIVTVTIKPQNIALTKLTRNVNIAEIRWATTRNASGYEIQYADNSSFKNPITITANGYTTATAKTYNLKPGTKYYVKIRTFYNVDRSTTLYSGWSATLTM